MQINKGAIDEWQLDKIRKTLSVQVSYLQRFMQWELTMSIIREQH